MYDFLIENEKVIWQGNSQKKFPISSVDILFIPVGIVWFYIVITMGLESFLHKNVSVDTVAWAFFMIFGLYFLIGRFFYRIYKQKNNQYFITSKRVLTIDHTITGKQRIIGEFITNIRPISHTLNAKGEGSIRFGKESFFRSMYDEAGFDFLGWLGPRAVTFSNIENVKEIMEIINNLRQKEQ